jgi:hypothetical protein
VTHADLVRAGRHPDLRRTLIEISAPVGMDIAS